MKNKIIFLFMVMFTPSTMDATIIKGRVKNPSGMGIPYVSVGVQNDSIFCISDSLGNFSIDVPSNRRQLMFHHISYETKTIDITTANSTEVILSPKTYDISEVNIEKQKMKQKILSFKGFHMPGVISFSGQNNRGAEFGPIITLKKDFLLKQISFMVNRSTYEECILSFNIYEIDSNKKQLICINTRPIYIKVYKNSEKCEIAHKINEQILLLSKKKYYLSLEQVDTKGNGHIDFPTYMKKGIARSNVFDKQKSLPFSIGMTAIGME